MNFYPEKVAFGRHESFPLRFGWLTKGFQAFLKNHEIFAKEEAIIELGVGRNMVHAIRYWLRATRMLELKANKLYATSLGNKIFSENGWDPYLEDEATIWLLHWQLATNYGEASSWYWFFNRFHKSEFTSAEQTTALLDFAKDNITARYSPATAKKDAAVLLRMYVQTADNGKAIAEEALDSPLSLLKLVSYSPTTKIYFSKAENNRDIPLGIFGYALAKIFEAYDLTEIPIEDLMYSKNGKVALGSIFRLTENGLLTKLEQLIHYKSGCYALRETAGIHQFYQVEKIEPMEFLEEHYSSWSKGMAA